MLRFNDDLFTAMYPTLDLHGETRFTMIHPLEVFINDNIRLQKEYIVIVHGRSGGVLKEEVHKYLKKDRRVVNFYVGFYNPGCTVVKLKLDNYEK